VRVRVAAEACWRGSARVQAAITMVIGEAVRACGWRCSGVRWSKLMVEVEYSDQSR
jgi:phage tail tape-measure protein